MAHNLTSNGSSYKVTFAETKEDVDKLINNGRDKLYCTLQDNLTSLNATDYIPTLKQSCTDLFKQRADKALEILKERYSSTAGELNLDDNSMEEMRFLLNVAHSNSKSDM